MDLTQPWNVTAGDSETVVHADNWLGALALALPELGLDLGAMGRLIIGTEPDGTATARDPRSGLELKVRPVGAATPPDFVMPESSFASINAPQLRVPAPVAEPGPPPAPSAPAPSPEPPPPSRTVELHGPAREVTPAVADPLEDRLETLFMRLGDINDAPTASAACASALEIAAELVRCDAGAVLLRTSAGDALRFRAAHGPAAKTVLDTTIPIDRGIAGFVWQLGLSITIGDARGDQRHYTRVDKSTGYTTRSILAAAVRTDTGGCYGVLELLNPPQDFTDDDLEIASRVAVTLANYLQGMHA
jgi:hypothetical protein